ncbi:hypothetical protein Val02_78690 [Virgisporangium aliadipatigenens]|uniref:Uncharacterized protein n=1 Tax=Virgisporangium aliadipatigenens TaxID=741659 RepID=A0A8J4DVB1_9ACTN|nr:hypothetical protein [Virgisporangium aliadipatigenens]GIJ50983.1 hypothetical protein Val02_78690 [Virgisporangium aliadipatigenens]
MHQPGIPADLDTPARMWARAATLAVLAAAGLSFDEMTLSDRGVYSWWGGGSVWWRLTLAPGGEAVLVGQDSDASSTHPAAGGGARDLLAGMPDRLAYPGLRADLDDFLVCFAYWFTDGSWHRVDYPAEVLDDGLKGAVGCLHDDAGAVRHALEMNGLDHHPEAEAAIDGFLRLAHGRAVDADAVSSMVTLVAAASPDFEGERPDTGKALEVAQRAGLGPTQGPPLLS